MTKTKEKKLSLGALILMTFTTVYGFNNMPRSFYLMGYSAIPFFIISVLFFFIPFAFMMAEYGAAFKNESGGIYSWMERSVSSKYAFVVTFMWYSSIVVWMVNVSSVIWITLSNAVFGKDTTSSWSLFGLSSTQTLGILAALWIVFVTFMCIRGMDKIKKVTSVGGIAVMTLNLVLFIGAIIVFIANGGKPAQPLNGITSMLQSPNPSYQSFISMMSFLVFTLFAFGGIEVIGGVVDKTENAEKNFPKGILIAAVIIGIGYAMGIFCVGIFTDWAGAVGPEGKYGGIVNLGNVSYLLMNNLGYQIGHALSLSEAVCVQLGNGIARIVGISMLLALTGAFFTMTYSPLKQLILGCPKGLIPERLAECREDGMPVNAMLLQGAVAIVMILMVSFGGSAMEEFFEILVSMTNVAMTIPYAFIAGAFISFKRKEEIKKPFVIFKKDRTSFIWTVIVSGIIAFANIFSIVEPAMNGQISKTVWSIAGPLVFVIAALLLYRRYENKMKYEDEFEEEEAAAV